MNYVTNSSAPSQPRAVMTVLGQVAYESMGLTDAHNHVWISQVPGAYPASPVLDRFEPMLQELIEYRE
ncbi:MAG: hypothetical protein ACM3MF_05740, partial [Anaerolineae bacterium]